MNESELKAIWLALAELQKKQAEVEKELISINRAMQRLLDIVSAEAQH